MKEVSVTQEEINEYLSFVSTQFASSGVKAQSTIWHYTSGEGLIGIIKSSEFWLTQISCVNDATEIRYSRSLLLQAIQLLREAERPTDDEAILYDEAINGLSIDVAPTSEWFIGCLSTNGDDLSQWRAYGGGEGGYAIGFDTSTLLPALSRDEVLLVPVCYDGKLHTKIAQAVSRATIDFYKKGLAGRPGVDRRVWARAFLEAWANAINYIAPMIKHPAFEAEQEWRLARKLRESDVPKLKYRQRQSMLARHLPLALRFHALTPPSEILPIFRVRVGPSRHKDISKVGVADLLRGMGYPEVVYKNVLVSDVPFQAF
jgi:hypothetical protein